jgi:hypothetical protein
MSDSPNPRLRKPVLSWTRVLLLALAVVSSQVEAGTDARQIMERVNERPTGDSVTADMRMVLIDREQRRRERRIRSFSKDEGEVKHAVLFFLAPADVKGTGFLTRSYESGDRDDEQWIYLPALHKTKRIASSDRSGSFMGSDFTYADLSAKDLDDYGYTLLKETEVEGQKAWLIQAVPRSPEVVEESGYEKSVLFVRQDNDVIVRAVHWVAGKPQLKYMEVKKLELIDDIWVATETQMTTKEGRQFVHQTLLVLDRVQFDLPLEDDLFTVRRLERGL